MINLLPTDIKQDIVYARKNTTLRHWIIAGLIVLMGLGFIVAGGWLYMQKTIDSYALQVEQSKKVLEAQKVNETQKRVEEISSSTKLAVQVLSREILFSKLIRQIGFALPASTTLNTLQIDKVQGGIQLNASALDFNAATQMQLNLQDPKNGVFEKADINNIDCAVAGTTSASGEAIERRYPCDVNIRALFGKNNSYVYIRPETNTSNPPKTGGSQ